MEKTNRKSGTIHRWSAKELSLLDQNFKNYLEVWWGVAWSPGGSIIYLAQLCHVAVELFKY